MKIESFLFSILIVVFIFSSCTKGGIGGKVELVAIPKHHSYTTPGATVYIKYNTVNFPGENVSQYDDSGKVSSVGGADPNFHFKNLKKGNYFLWAVGYDSTFSFAPVKGGVPVKISVKSGTVDVEIPMTN